MSFILLQMLKLRLPRCLAWSIRAPEGSCGSSSRGRCSLSTAALKETSSALSSSSVALTVCERAAISLLTASIFSSIILLFCSSSSLSAAILASSSSSRNCCESALLTVGEKQKEMKGSSFSSSSCSSRSSSSSLPLPRLTLVRSSDRMRKETSSALSSSSVALTVCERAAISLLTASIFSSIILLFCSSSSLSAAILASFPLPETASSMGLNLWSLCFSESLQTRHTGRSSSDLEAMLSLSEAENTADRKYIQVRVPWEGALHFDLDVRQRVEQILVGGVVEAERVLKLRPDVRSGGTEEFSSRGITATTKMATAMIPAPRPEYRATSLELSIPEETGQNTNKFRVNETPDSLSAAEPVIECHRRTGGRVVPRVGEPRLVDDQVVVGSRVDVDVACDQPYLGDGHPLRRAAVQNDHHVDGNLLPLGVLLKVLPQVCEGDKSSCQVSSDADRGLAALRRPEVAPGDTETPIILGAVEILHLLPGHIDHHLPNLQP
ncbi:hypothetical protein F7725_012191 [Dissostichus mawsoni]|uniref:Transmembrane protein n=1 Tax=Dissostichus mawsoni TaxID=36200 RepID=A0A7J5YNU5_DISMA|nr:hypothetical protein F7725_012191 [Dissostichus mawsoni]